MKDVRMQVKRIAFTIFFFYYAASAIGMAALFQTFQYTGFLQAIVHSVYGNSPIGPSFLSISLGLFCVIRCTSSSESGTKSALSAMGLGLIVS